LGLVGPEMSRRVGEARLEADAWRGGCRVNSTWGDCGRWSACVPNEFGLQRPLADGRPAPTEKRSLRGRRPTLSAERP